MLPIYVINLDRRPDRLASIAEMLERLGLAFERVPAVDAHEMPREDCGPIMDMGAKACVLSHSEALRRFLRSRSPAALILEDDVELAEDIPALLKNTDWWPGGTGVVQLHTPGRRRKLQGWYCGWTPSGRDLRTIVRWNACAGAYLLNRAAARLLLVAYAECDLPTDHVMFDPRVSATARDLRPVQVIPAAARQTGQGSDLSDWAPSGREKHRKKLHMLRRRSKTWKLRVLWWRITLRANKMHVLFWNGPGG